MILSEAIRQEYFALSQYTDSLGQDWDRPVNTGLSQYIDSLGQDWDSPVITKLSQYPDSLGQTWDSAPKSVPVSQSGGMTGTAETRLSLRVVPAVPVVPVDCLVRVLARTCARARACAYTRARVPCLFTGTTGTTGTVAKMGGRHG